VIPAHARAARGVGGGMCRERRSKTRRTEMPMYEVKVAYTEIGFVLYEVEADDETEARKLVTEMESDDNYNAGDPQWGCGNMDRESRVTEVTRLTNDDDDDDHRQGGDPDDEPPSPPNDGEKLENETV
jgi:hypothetical protein